MEQRPRETQWVPGLGPQRWRWRRGGRLKSQGEMSSIRGPPGIWGQEDGGIEADTWLVVPGREGQLPEKGHQRRAPGVRQSAQSEKWQA